MSKKLTQEQAIEFIEKKIGRRPHCEYKSKRAIALAAGIHYECVYRALRGEGKLPKKLLALVGLIEVEVPPKYEFIEVTK